MIGGRRKAFVSRRLAARGNDSTPDVTQHNTSQGKGQTNHQQQQLALARAHVAAFATPDNAQAARTVLLTFALWIGSWALGPLVLGPRAHNTWWGWALVAGWLFMRVGSHIRAFTLMHDAAHRSLFSHRWMNDMVCLLSGFLITIDGPDFRKTHQYHHAVSSMEDEVHKDPSHPLIFTTQQWAAWPRGISKLAARIFRDPLVYFTVFAPIFTVYFNVAWPLRVSHQTRCARMLHLLFRPVFILASMSFFSALGGWHGWAPALGEMGAIAFTCSYTHFIGNLQHVYEGAYRAPRLQFNRGKAALAGSSCIIMPWWWRWAALGVDYHHIHHLNTFVPGYHLKECHDTAPPGLWEELGVQSLSWRTACHSLLLALWDPDTRRYVPFPEWQWLEKLLLPELHQHQQQTNTCVHCTAIVLPHCCCKTCGPQ